MKPRRPRASKGYRPWRGTRGSILSPAQRCGAAASIAAEALSMRIYSNKSMKNPARRGFTLVEILAVLVIIGIASAIVIPQLATRDDLRAAAAARILVADLIYAQNMAISQQRPIYVRFDKANNKYSLLSVANSG